MPEGRAPSIVYIVLCAAMLMMAFVVMRHTIAREDEGEIVFTSDQAGIWDLYVMDGDGSNVRRLTYGVWGLEPCWSPDGRNIVFTACLQQQPAYEIYIIDSDGGNMKRLTKTPSQYGCRSPSWSPDGKKIVFASERTRPSKIMMMDADGNDPEVLIDVTGWNWFRSSWSLGGKKIAFSNDAPGNPDDYDIWVADTDGSNGEKFINMPGSDIQPAWHPDGKSMVFANIGSDYQGDMKGGLNNQIYVIDADGQNRNKLTDGWCPSWSPDGRRIVFASDRDGDMDIYVIDADGGNLEKLTHNTAWDAYPHWWGAPMSVEPDGKLESTWGEIKALRKER